MVVEDDRLSRELLCEVLKAYDIEAWAFGDGITAAQSLQRERFDGIFLDLNMPGMNGLELARLARGSARNATTPIVVITGNSSKTVMDEAFQAGAHFFVQKPLDRHRLRNLLNSTYGTLLQERRKRLRAPLQTPVCCRTETGEFRGQASQISEEGMVFRFQGDLPAGSAIRVEFSLPPSPHAWEAQAVVLRTDTESRAGCRFHNLSSETRQAIRDYIAANPAAA
jgi:CheY-like chemotaxis protein